MITLKSDWPGWDSPTIDALYHHIWAQQIAAGDILGGGPYFRAPLYPFMLGMIYVIFGPDFNIVIMLQHLMGLTAIPLVFLLARRFFSVKIAYVAAFITSINGVLIYFESQLLLDFMLVIYMLIIVLSLVSAHKNNKSWLYLFAGLTIGLFAITRPNILAIIPLICVWIIIAGDDFKRGIKQSLLVLCGIIILVLPVTVRNIVIGGDTVLVASQGGINFYIGNNERADGFTALLPGFGHTWQYSDAEFEAAQEIGKKPGVIKPSEVSGFYYDKALDYIFSEPVDFLKLIIKKLYMFWNRFEISNNNNLYFLTDYIGMSFMPLFLFMFISPLGLVGSVLCFFKDRRYWLFPILIFGYMATIVAFFVTARFRIPLVPLLTIMAVFAVHEIYSAWRDKRYKYSLILAASSLLIGIITWTNLYDHHDRSMAMANYSLGNMFMKKGDHQAARKQYESTIDQGARVPNAHLNLGVIAFYNGDTTRAREQFTDEIKSCGPSGKAYNNLSMLASLKGDYSQANAFADSAIYHFPNFKEAYINKISAAMAKRDTMMTRLSVIDFRRKFPENPAAKYYHGMYLLQTGNHARAEAEFKSVALAGDKDIVAEYDLSEIYSSALPYGYNPRKIRGRSFYQLGLILARKGEIDSALDYFKQAALLLPNDADARVNLALAYDNANDYHKAESEFIKAIEIDSTRAIYYYNYAMTLGKTGNYSKAASMLEKAIELEPDFKQAQQVLRALRREIK
ncbi:MAG: tetratricopeptide repeat protein [candidate division Zixibacteria bacterium]|nr:tetratricopeptide repeat protein [candidate division Zixibacteria bacterium]